MKHHDQLRGKGFIWACSFSGRIHHSRRGLAEHGRSRKMEGQLFNYVGKSGRATRKLSDAIYAQSLSQGCSSFSKAPHPESSTVSPNTTANWGPNLQIHEPMWGISFKPQQSRWSRIPGRNESIHRWKVMAVHW